MSGFPILDLVIGIIFIYFLLSVISSSAIELILTGLRARATLLEEWLFKIFDKPITQPDGSVIRLGQAIMDHCSVTVLSGKGKSTSYIDARNFAAALLEKITYDPANPKSIAKDIDEFITAISNTPVLSTEFQRVLLTYANEAKETYKALSEKTVSEIDLFRGKVENWYDSSMERVTDVLKKRYSRPATIFVAIIIAGLLNADSIAIAKYLYSNPEVRTKIALQAANAVKDTSFINSVYQYKAISVNTSASDTMSLTKLNDIINDKIAAIDMAKQGLDDAMPLLWKTHELSDKRDKFSWALLISKITGLLVTVLAILMGAPFWFDLLNKVSNLRGSGPRPPLSSTEEERKKN